MSISRFAPDSGRVKILHDLDSDISGRDVVVVEDIVDTGLTLAYLMGQLARAGAPVARRRARCSTARRGGSCPHDLRYRGLELDDEFVLGYGLHARDLYRNLPFVAAGDRERGRGHARRPTSTQLYGGETPGTPGKCELGPVVA